MAACSWIHVLDFGLHLMSGTPEEVRADPRVQEAYLGSAQAEDDVIGDGSGAGEPALGMGAQR
jgi:branched-subunit amino acid ATP-binding cassette transporter